MVHEPITISVLPVDFEAAKDRRASITDCLVATTLKRLFPNREVSVGIIHARIDESRYVIDSDGAQLIRDFVLHRDELVVPFLPFEITLTPVPDFNYGIDELDEGSY